MTIQNILSPTGALGGEFSPETVGLGNVDNTSDMDKPVSNPQQVVFDTKLNISDALSNTVAPITFYFEDDTYVVPIDLIYTDGLLIAPSTKVENIDTFTVNNNSVNSHNYVSIPLGISTIPAGNYEYNYWAKVSNAAGVTTLSFKWYVHTPAEVSTLLFTHTTPEINDLDFIQRTLSITQATDIIISPLDRIIIEVWATTDNVGEVIVSFAHQGSTRNSNVSTPITSSITNIVQSALDLKQDRIDKDVAEGFVGLTALKVNMRNVANTHTSFLTNTNIDSRTYTFPDKDCTLADAADITGTNSGTNTGDQVGDGTSISGSGTIADPFTIIGGVATTLLIDAREANVSAIKKGQAVHIAGSDGEYPTVHVASPDILGHFGVIGLAESDINKAGYGRIVIQGLLNDTGTDTRPTNLAINPLAETWLPGDQLYLSYNGGGLTHIYPSIGRAVEVGYSIKGSHATDHIVVSVIVRPVVLTAASTEEIYLRMGDDIGDNKVTFKNHSNVDVATIDSLGNISGLNLSNTNTGDETASTIRTKLGISTLSGSNTGDQTSIVGITGTTAEFNTALSDADFATGGGTATGTNTGDNATNTQYSSLVSNATHSGEVSGSTTLTIANKAVTLAKMNDLAQSTIIGRVTLSTGVPEALSATNVRTIINVADGANVGVVPNVGITGATKTKIAYDAKGLVTSGADATTADIADSSNKRYVTDAQLVVIGNTSGTNSGNQTSIVGISGTTAEFNTALTDANFATGGGTATGSNTGDQTSIVGITGTTAQFNTALSDADFATGGGTATGTNTGDNATNTQYSPLLSAAFITIGANATLSGERSLAVTANQITLTDGGANSTATLAIAANPILPGTDAVTLPTGTTGERPVSPVAGMLRENSTLTIFEGYNNGYWSRLGMVKQYITGNIPQAAAGATTIPFDTSTPIITEGTQIWTGTITPLSTTNKVIVRFSVGVDCGTSNRGIAVALFRDSTCIAVHTAHIAAINLGSIIAFNEVDIPGVTTATVYSARIGCSGSGNIFVNRLSTATFGGTVTSSYTLEEIVA